MKKVLENLTDVKLMVDTFYEHVKRDYLLGPIFADANLNWEEHLAILYRFWETVLFMAGTYRGNPLKPHLELDDEQPLNKEHFDRWLEVFKENVDEYFIGERAEAAKSRAEQIAKFMLEKIQAKTLK